MRTMRMLLQHGRYVQLLLLLRTSVSQTGWAPAAVRDNGGKGGGMKVDHVDTRSCRVRRYGWPTACPGMCELWIMVRSVVCTELAVAQTGSPDRIK
jgi:hypothetical protein